MAAIAIGLAASAALASAPGQVAFQGLLTDDLGAPLTQTVTLDFTLYDALTGGTSLWSETHAGTPVVDGLYDVQLGSITPLTPAILGNAPVFLEIRVDAEILTPRNQLLSVPYALRAEQADAADTVGGVVSGVITQIWENTSFDGADPPNDDPLEGLLDSDGDGIANFIETDNDDDGFSDAIELAGGTNLNVPTPVISSLTPSAGEAVLSTPVTVAGVNFSAGQTVTVDGQAVTPQSLTSTSFGLDLGPDAVGPVDVVVSDPGGDSSTAVFTFFDTAPSIASFSPPIGDATQSQVVTVNGSGFLPGLTVQFGSETPAASNLNPTSFQVTVGPQAVGTANVVVTNPNTLSDSASYVFFGGDTKFVFVSDTELTGSLGGIPGSTAFCTNQASAAGLSGIFFAWIATQASDAPNNRFTQSSNPYRLVDLTIVADDYADLTDGTLDAPINLTAMGNVPSDSNAWTNVDRFGNVLTTDPARTCSGWTSSTAGNGEVGAVAQSNFLWTEATAAAKACGSTRVVYCFQQ